MDQVCKSFKLPTEDFKVAKEIESLGKYSNLTTEHFDTIDQIDKKEWNSLFSFNQQLSHSQISIFEKSFTGHDAKENNWEFDYVKIKSPEGKVIIASPLFTTLQKDDFLHPDGISKSIEAIRNNDPYYLTSRVLSSGSPVNIGQSIYIDDDSIYLSEAIEKFTNLLSKIQEKRNAKTIMLRDFMTPGTKTKEKFQQEGYILSEILSTNIVEKLPNSVDEYRASLSKKSRKNIRIKVDANSSKFEYEKLQHIDKKDIKLFHDLYLSVSRRKHEINGFEMPLSFFEEISTSDEWEIHCLKDSLTKDVAAAIFVHVDRANNRITPNYLGLSDTYLGMGVYHIILYNLMTYSIKNDYTSIDLGATCNFEKSRFGTINVPLNAFIQAEDHYNQAHMETVHQAPNRSVMTS
jgi:predicted N-acyltransferase